MDGPPGARPLREAPPPDRPPDEGRRSLRAWGEARLRASGLDAHEAAVEADLLLRHAAGLTREEMLLRPDGPVGAAVRVYADLVDRRAAGWPSAYLLGRREFYGLVLGVDPRVLIPRPETERLVEVVVASLAEIPVAPRGGRPGSARREVGAPRCHSSRRPPGCPLIVDVGTGSGAVALAVAHLLPAARIIATDISSGALAAARSNAERLGFADRLTWRHGDALEPLDGCVPEKSADAICANPPYIPTADVAALPRDVRAHEPLVALDGGPDGLAIHRRIIGAAPRYLRPGGVLALETSALDGQAGAVAGLIAREEEFARAEIVRDYAGLERVVVARRH